MPIIDLVGKRNPKRFELRREAERIQRSLAYNAIIRKAEVWVDSNGARAYLRAHASRAEKAEFTRLKNANWPGRRGGQESKT
jgi:hypothetical protein